MLSIQSINNVSIDISRERWKLITEAHPEISLQQDNVIETIEDPDTVYVGFKSRLIAVKQIDRRKYLVVIYDEKIKKIITVFICNQTLQFEDMEVQWKKNT